MDNSITPVTPIAYPIKTLIKTVPYTYINSKNELIMRNTLYETTLYNCKGIVYSINKSYSINYTV